MVNYPKISAIRQAIWLDQITHPKNSSYNFSFACSLNKKDRNRLVSAVVEFVEANKSLHYVYPIKNGAMGLSAKKFDLSSLKRLPKISSRSLLSVLHENQSTPFNLCEEHSYRFYFYECEKKIVFQTVAHHIDFDAITFEILVGEIEASLDGSLKGNVIQLCEPEEELPLNVTKIKKWLKNEGYLGLENTTSFSRELQLQTFSTSVPKKQLAELNKISKVCNVSVFKAVFALVALKQLALSKGKSFLINSAVTTRTFNQAYALNCFTNNIIVPLNSAVGNFKEHMSTVLDGFDMSPKNIMVPFAAVRQALGKAAPTVFVVSQRTKEKKEYADFMFGPAGKKTKIGDIDIESLGFGYPPSGILRNDLVFYVAEGREHYYFRTNFDPQTYTSSVIQFWHEHLVKLIKNAATVLDTNLADTCKKIRGLGVPKQSAPLSPPDYHPSTLSREG